ncbi:MAG TPA: hypothetical protein VF049_05655 [Nocardioidaceae bacterium]
MAAFPYQSVTQPGVFHTHDCCPQGARIPVQEREPAGIDAVLCSVCGVLDDLLAPPPDPMNLRR